MIIHPEVFATPDHPTVKFRQPMDTINLDIELPKILHSQGWDCGTYFHVQFISHDRNQLLYSAEFVVESVDESLHTNDDNPYAPVTKTIYHRKAVMIGAPWVSTVKGTEPTIKWNPGRKVHQLMKGDEVIFENKDKDLVIQKASEAA